MVSDNFSELYDAAMASRQQIFHEMTLMKGRDDIEFIGINRFCILEVSDVVNYVINIMPRPGELHSIFLRAYEGNSVKRRDCTVEEIRQVTELALAKMREFTTEGRIAALKAEIEKLERGEESDDE